MMSQISGTSWTFLTENATDFNNADRRHFCVVALGDEASDDIAWNNGIRTCYKTNTIVTFPSGLSPGADQLQSLFSDAWQNGAADIIAVVQQEQCHIFTFVPFREGGECNDTRPVLVHSWVKNLTSSMTTGPLYFPENRVTRLHSCEVNLKYLPGGENNVQWYWFFLEFLLKAMDSSKKCLHDIDVTQTSGYDLPGCEAGLPLIGIYFEPLTDVQENSNVISSLLDPLTYGFIVPRIPLSSVHWLRLVNELSCDVWLGVAMSLVLSSVCIYVFMNDKDIILVVLYTLQPLLGVSWSEKFSSWQPRAFFVSWLLFCFLINSSYLCSLLSELTAPSNDDAIKSLGDLVESDLPIFSPVGSGKVSLDYLYEYVPFGDALKDQTTLTTLSAAKNKFDERNHDWAFFASLDYWPYMFVNMSYKLLPDVVNIPFAPLVMCRRTPYERLFQISVLRVLGAGAFDYCERAFRGWTYLGMRRQVWEVKGPKPLSYSSFYELFVLWALGCTLAAFAFSVEYLYYNFMATSRKTSF